MVPVAAVSATETTVEAREASVPSGVKPATMKSAKSSVESTFAAESTSAVKTSAPAMRASIGWV